MKLSYLGHACVHIKSEKNERGLLFDPWIFGGSWAETLRLRKEWDPKSVDKVVNNRLIKFFFDFDKDDKVQQELMFRMKLRIFEKDEVKNAKDKDAEKSDIRKAETPLDVILSYATVINKLGKRFKK